MAAEIEALTNGATIKQSIGLVELRTNANLDPDEWRLVIHFEDNLYDANGAFVKPIQFGSLVFEKRFGDIKSDPDIINLVLMIKTKAYAYRDQYLKSRSEALTSINKPSIQETSDNESQP